MAKMCNDGKFWTDEEDNRLRQLAKEKKLYEISEELGRSPMAIILRIRQITGMENPYDKSAIPASFFDQTLTTRQRHISHGDSWGPGDDDKLETLFVKNKKSVLEIATIMNRTVTAIIKHLCSLYPRRMDMEQLFNDTKFWLRFKSIGLHSAPDYVEEQEQITIPDELPEPIEETASEAEANAETTSPSYLEQKRSKYANYGKPWSKADDELLTTLFVDKECAIWLIMQVFRRNRGGIVGRLRHLGLVE